MNLDMGVNVQCGCDHITAANRLHCLQSVETTHDAVTEGFAQFFASALYNGPVTEGGVSSAEPCTFWYYKEGLLDACPDEALYDCTPVGDKVKVMPPFPVACAAADQWRDQVCGGAATAPNPVLENMGTERDWMQFLFNWNRRGPSNSSMFEMQQTQSQMCGPMECVDADGTRLANCQTPACTTIAGLIPNNDWDDPSDVTATVGAVRFVWELRPAPAKPANAIYPNTAFAEWQLAYNRWSEERSMRQGAVDYFEPLDAAGDPTALDRRNHFLEMARTRGVDQETTVVPP
jgi:hypothetical protein